MQSTRQRILDYLEARGSASARQMAQAFGMTAQNLRRHLHILQERGLVVTLAEEPARGRGRPQLSYALTEQAQGDNLAGLGRALLRALPQREAQRGQALRRVAGQLLAQDAPVTPKRSGGGAARLAAAVRSLEPQGYKPRWEARPGSPQVVLGHCPFAAIIAEHPELCQVDAYMLEELLGAPVEQLEKLQPGPQGTLQCVFRLGGKS